MVKEREEKKIDDKDCEALYLEVGRVGPNTVAGRTDDGGFLDVTGANEAVD